MLRQIEMLLPHLKDGAVVLVSAQLPVGSVAALEQAFARQAGGRTVSFACSPENLRLGQAIEVFQNPGRIVVGMRDQRARAILEPLLGKFCDNLIWMSVEFAEMVKHGLNSFLADVGDLRQRARHGLRAGRRRRRRGRKGAAVRSAHRRRAPMSGPVPRLRAARSRATCNSSLVSRGSKASSLPVIDGVIASNRHTASGLTGS